MAEKALVGIVMGSDSDWDTLEPAVTRLRAFGVACEVNAMSAHRTPTLVAEYAAGARGRGLKVIIAAAGGAAHLAGVVAAHTTLPVIGVPVGSALNGLDSLLSTVQMPAGVPVATVAIGKAGAENAAILAVQILGVADAAMASALDRFKTEMAAAVATKNARLQKKVFPELAD